MPVIPFVMFKVAAALSVAACIAVFLFYQYLVHVIRKWNCENIRKGGE